MHDPAPQPRQRRLYRGSVHAHNLCRPAIRFRRTGQSPDARRIAPKLFGSHGRRPDHQERRAYRGACLRSLRAFPGGQAVRGLSLQDDPGLLGRPRAAAWVRQYVGARSARFSRLTPMSNPASERHVPQGGEALYNSGTGLGCVVEQGHMGNAGRNGLDVNLPLPE